MSRAASADDSHVHAVHSKDVKDRSRALDSIARGAVEEGLAAGGVWSPSEGRTR